jgi:hypothetical protein
LSKRIQLITGRKGEDNREIPDIRISPPSLNQLYGKRAKLERFCLVPSFSSKVNKQREEDNQNGHKGKGNLCDVAVQDFVNVGPFLPVVFHDVPVKEEDEDRQEVSWREVLDNEFEKGGNLEPPVLLQIPFQSQHHQNRLLHCSKKENPHLASEIIASSA